MITFNAPLMLLLLCSKFQNSVNVINHLARCFFVGARLKMSGGGRLLTTILARSPWLGLGLREKAVGMLERGGVGACCVGLGLRFDIMADIMSEGLGLGVGLEEEADDGEEDRPWRG